MASLSLVNFSAERMTLELRCVHDDMVAWSNDDIRFRIACLYAPADVAYTGSCIAAAGLREDILHWHLWQLGMYLADIA